MQMVKNVFEDRKIKLTYIKRKIGETLFEESEIANRLKEYIEYLYGEEKDSDKRLEEKKEDRLNSEDED